MSARTTISKQFDWFDGPRAAILCTSINDLATTDTPTEIAGDPSMIIRTAKKGADESDDA